MRVRYNWNGREWVFFDVEDMEYAHLLAAEGKLPLDIRREFIASGFDSAYASRIGICACRRDTSDG